MKIGELKPKSKFYAKDCDLSGIVVSHGYGCTVVDLEVRAKSATAKSKSYRRRVTVSNSTEVERR